MDFIIENSSIYPETLAGLRTEIMNEFSNYLEHMDRLVAPGDNEDQRKEVLAKLEKLRNRLSD